MENLAIEKKVANLGEAARRYVRIDADKVIRAIPDYVGSKIKIEILQQKTKITGVLIDISKGGLAVLCEGDGLNEDYFVRNDELSIMVEFSIMTVFCKASVCHADVLAGVGYIGVEFVQIYGDGKEFIEKLIDSILS